MFDAIQNLLSPPRHLILLIVASWIGLTLSEKRSEQHSTSKEDLNNIIFYGLAAFILGGRILYVLQNLSAFIKSPAGIISINPDLFDPMGGVAAGFITLLIYAQQKNIPLWNALDALTPFFAVIAIGLGLSNLASGNAFGIPTDLPWGIDLWNATRHPTQLYETLASSLVLILIWRFKPTFRPGIQFLTFIALTAFSQILLQAFRANYTVLFDRFRGEQIFAWLILLACFILIEFRLKPQTKTG
jgi:phosphatidylglycerol:prolipoprotein diacylglycerol transferase